MQSWDQILLKGGINTNAQSTWWVTGFTLFLIFLFGLCSILNLYDGSSWAITWALALAVIGFAACYCMARSAIHGVLLSMAKDIAEEKQKEDAHRYREQLKQQTA